MKIHFNKAILFLKLRKICNSVNVESFVPYLNLKYGLLMKYLTTTSQNKGVMKEASTLGQAQLFQGPNPHSYSPPPSVPSYPFLGTFCWAICMYPPPKDFLLKSGLDENSFLTVIFSKWKKKQKHFGKWWVNKRKYE